MPRLAGLIRGGAAVLRARFDRGYRSPIGLYLCLTTRCDGACRYCRFPELEASTPAEIAGAAAREYLAQAARAGVRRLNLTGGEPLLHPELGAIIRRAVELGMFVTVSTNGLRLAERGAELREAELVMVSCDGDRGTHDRLRGAGSYDRVVAGLETLATAGTRFWLTTVLTAPALDHVDDVLALAARFGTVANFVLLNTVPESCAGSHIPAGRQLGELVPEPVALRRALAALLGRKRAGAPVGSSVAYLETLRRWPDYARLWSPQPDGYRCQAGRLYAHLYPDHRLYACGQAFGRTPGVALQPRGFAAAWAELAPPPDCRSCRVGCDLENNLIYNLRWSSIGNWLRRL